MKRRYEFDMWVRITSGKPFIKIQMEVIFENLYLFWDPSCCDHYYSSKWNIWQHEYVMQTEFRKIEFNSEKRKLWWAFL